MPETFDRLSKHERIRLLTGHIWDMEKRRPYRRVIRQRIEENYRIVSRWNCYWDVRLFLYVRKDETTEPHDSIKND